MNTKKYLLSLFFFLIVFISIITVKFFFSYTLSSKTSGIVGYLQQDSIDILFVGSSVFRQNYAMEILEKQTGKRCYMLAYNGLTPSFSYAILSYFLSKSYLPKPKILVFDANPHTAIDKTRIGDIRLMNDAPAPLKWNFIQITQNQVTMTPKSWWHALVQNNETLISYPFTHQYMDTYSYKGSYINKTQPGINQQAFEAIKDPLAIQYGDDYSVSQLNRYEAIAHKNIQYLCKNNDIEVYYLFPPVSQFITEKPPFTMLKNLLNNYLIDSLHIPQKHIIYPDSFPFNRKDASNFSNGFHLSTQGRDSISVILGERLKALLALSHLRQL